MKPAILFLDFDGVLHHDDAYRYGNKIVIKADGYTLFEYARHLEEILDDFPSVRINLSTSWVRGLRFDRAKTWLPEKLRNKVMGATWHSRMDQYHWNTLNRYQEIMQYVCRHGLNNWVALDNDSTGWKTHHDHFVHTDDVLGISEARKQDELRQKLFTFTYE